jgi:hypothetical protein
LGDRHQSLIFARPFLVFCLVQLNLEFLRSTPAIGFGKFLADVHLPYRHFDKLHQLHAPNPYTRMIAG